MCFSEQLAECSVVYDLVRWRSNVGEGTLGVDELVGDRVVELITCEGEGDVTGVEAPLGRVVQDIFHGVQVVEVGVQVRVHQDRGVEEDGEGQVDVEREEGEVKENRTSWMTWREDDGHLNDLSHEDHDSTSEKQETQLNSALLCSLRADRARRDCSCHSCWCTWCHDCCPHWS